MNRSLNSTFVLDSLRAKLLLALCCILCYAYTVRNGYSLDDDFAFYDNAYVQEGIKGIPDLLTHPYYSDAHLSLDYRPIAGITFAIEKEFFGNNPHVSHFINLLLYIITVILVFQLFVRVFSLDILLSFIIALFYAVHPAHIEVVASIKNREELFSFLFAVLTFIYVHKLFEQKTSQKRVVGVLIVMLFLLLSFASKMTNITLIPIIFLYLYFKGYHREKKLFYPFVILVSVFTMLYTGRLYMMLQRPIYDLENPMVLIHDLSTKLGTGMASLFFYFRFMLVPYPFSFFYGFNTIPLVGMDEPIPVLSTVLHLILFIYGVVLFLKKDKTGFFIIAYFGAISVYSNLIMLYTGIVSERALFSPSVWFIASICSYLYSRVSSVKDAKIRSTSEIAVMGSAAIVLTVYGALDINRVTEWHDRISLMNADVKHLQNSTLANYFYGCVLKKEAEDQRDTAVQNKYLTESKQYLYHVCTLSPAYPYGYFRLGQIYRYDRYQSDSAYYYFKKAYANGSDLTDVAYQYGRLEYEVGDKNLSSDVFSKLYQKLPGDTFTVFYHALLLMKTGHAEEGHKVNAIFMKMAPSYYQSYFNEGIYYQFIGDADNAAKNYETSVRLGCIDPTVYRFLADYYQSHSLTDDANRYNKLIQ